MTSLREPSVLVMNDSLPIKTLMIRSALTRPEFRPKRRGAVLTAVLVAELLYEIIYKEVSGIVLDVIEVRKMELL